LAAVEGVGVTAFGGGGNGTVTRSGPGGSGGGGPCGGGRCRIAAGGGGPEPQTLGPTGTSAQQSPESPSGSTPDPVPPNARCAVGNSRFSGAPVG